jgi:hypothetical protein
MLLDGKKVPVWGWVRQVTARFLSRLVLCIIHFIPVHWIASSVVPYSRPRRSCAGSQLLSGEKKLKCASVTVWGLYFEADSEKMDPKVKTGLNIMSPQQLLKQVILSLSASSSRLTNVWGGGGQGWFLPPPPRSAHLGLNIPQPASGRKGFRGSITMDSIMASKKIGGLGFPDDAPSNKILYVSSDSSLSTAI